MAYTITSSTTSDQIASYLNTEFSAIYQLAVFAATSAATVISNVCTVPSPLVNPPLFALQSIHQLEKIYFLDLERSASNAQVKQRIISYLGLLQQIANSAPASPTNVANLLSARLLIISAMASSRLTSNSPLGSLQLCCQELAGTLTTAELQVASLDASNLLVAFAADVQNTASDILAAYQLAASTSLAMSQGSTPPSMAYVILDDVAV